MKDRQTRESETGGDIVSGSVERYIAQKEAQMWKKRWGSVQDKVAKVSQRISDAVDPLVSSET